MKNANDVMKSSYVPGLLAAVVTEHTIFVLTFDLFSWLHSQNIFVDS